MKYSCGSSGSTPSSVKTIPMMLDHTVRVSARRIYVAVSSHFELQYSSWSIYRMSDVESRIVEWAKAR